MNFLVDLNFNEMVFRTFQCHHEFSMLDLQLHMYTHKLWAPVTRRRSSRCKAILSVMFRLVEIAFTKSPKIKWYRTFHDLQHKIWRIADRGQTDSPMSQCSPVNTAGHWQVKFLPVFMHVALFAHGELAHGSISAHLKSKTTPSAGETLNWTILNFEIWRVLHACCAICA